MILIARLPFALAALTALALPAGTSLAQSASPYTVVETGQSYARLQQAVDAIGAGDGTIAVAPGSHRECAVQAAGSIAYFAITPGKASFDGVACEGKAALVLRGRDAKVSGLTFSGIRVPDGNGAGIRLEHGNLIVAQSWFRDSQQGILAGADPQSWLTIDKSTFTRLGTCEGAGGCAHSVYIGDYRTVRVTRSRFEEGRGGHYLKSRSGRIDIAANSFDDARGKGTNYMIDLPSGATGTIANNWFVQGPDKENHSAFIAIAAEGQQHSSAGLQIAGNDARMAPGVPWSSNFVADWSGEELAMGDNRLGAGLARYDRR